MVPVHEAGDDLPAHQLDGWLRYLRGNPDESWRPSSSAAASRSSSGRSQYPSGTRSTTLGVGVLDDPSATGTSRVYLPAIVNVPDGDLIPGSASHFCLTTV
jgi:hypothetical protein